MTMQAAVPLRLQCLLCAEGLAPHSLHEVCPRNPERLWKRMREHPESASTPDEYEVAVWAWWIPEAARDVWLNPNKLTLWLRVILNLKRAKFPDRPLGAADIEHAIVERFPSLRRGYEDAWDKICNIIDPMFDANASPLKIEMAIDREARRCGFADLDWTPLIRDRVGAWRWRQRHQRRAA